MGKYYILNNYLSKQLQMINDELLQMINKWYSGKVT